MKRESALPLTLPGTIAFLHRPGSERDIPAYFVDLGEDAQPLGPECEEYKRVGFEIIPKEHEFIYSLTLGRVPAMNFTRTPLLAVPDEALVLRSTLCVTPDVHRLYTEKLYRAGVWFLVVLTRGATEFLISRQSGSVYHVLPKKRSEYAFIT